MRRSGVVAVVCCAVLGTAACSGADDAGVSVPSTPAPSAQPENTGATPAADRPGSGKGELNAKPVKHTVRSNDLTVDIVYTPATPVSGWTADSQKPLEVAVTLHNRRKPKQKIYLSRATARFSASNGEADLAAPDPIVDNANIVPGYLVTSPFEYYQSFAIPPLDSASNQLTVRLKLECVALVDAKSKDYTKQTISDSVTATLNF
jgi:hypothetical protein